MRLGLDPFTFVVISVGWMNQRQQQVIEYLVEENRVLHGQIGKPSNPIYGRSAMSVSSKGQEAWP
jgi:hypothetical protein